jgi:sugar/nucleoside kinase (ribokinase family)
MEKMRDFATKIDAAAGLSANFEFVTQMVKLGGNGPIMANALCSYGTPVTYIGNLGAPNVHPVFADLAKRAQVRSIAEPGYTDAIEFEDGKLMCGKHESLKDVNWANLIAHVPEAELVRIFSDSSLIALVNWTMLTHLMSIWQKIATRIAPKLKGEKRWLFFDLCDPAKRSPEDLKAALKQISKFEKHFRVILGLNLAESRQVGEVLGFKAPDETYGTVTQHADNIRTALKIDTVVIHPTQFAAAADVHGATHVVGPFTAKPKITTGAGDHFNAGFCLGRLLGLDLAASLQIGVATSGFYVRNAKSPQLEDLRKFLLTL